jgi:hypothetical protein
MTTAAQLRDAIKRAAARSMEQEPCDVNSRARAFIARLSGLMVHMQETELDKILWGLLTHPAKPEAPPCDS